MECVVLNKEKYFFAELYNVGHPVGDTVLQCKYEWNTAAIYVT